MWGITKTELIAGVENIRRAVCCYSAPDYCDCKYGPDYKPGSLIMGGSPHGGENTGCCELRMVKALLEVMEEGTFKVLCANAGIHNPDEIFFSKGGGE